MRPELAVMCGICVLGGIIVGVVISEIMSAGSHRLEVSDGDVQHSLAVLCVQYGYSPDVREVAWAKEGYSVKCNHWNVNVTLNISK